MARCELYAGTGFDANNVPENIDLVRNHCRRVKTYTDINVIQSDFLAQITVDDLNNDVARGVDYILISDDRNNWVAYYVIEFKFVAPGTCTFSLFLDAYATIGGLGENNIIVSGVVKRRHVSDEEDEGNWYTLPEPFQPALRDKLTIKEFTTVPNEEPYCFIETISAPSQRAGF